MSQFHLLLCLSLVFLNYPLMVVRATSPAVNIVAATASTSAVREPQPQAGSTERRAETSVASTRSAASVPQLTSKRNSTESNATNPVDHLKDLVRAIIFAVVIGQGACFNAK
jgi:hypothetical protein